MVEEKKKVDPFPVAEKAWQAYNKRVAEIREEYATNQEELRKSLDKQVETAQKEHQIELHKLQVWFDDELAKARAELAASVKE